MWGMSDGIGVFGLGVLVFCGLWLVCLVLCMVVVLVGF